MTDDQREAQRRSPEPVSKSTGVYLSIGFIIMLVVSGGWLGREIATLEKDAAAQDMEITRNTRRFNSYSGKDGSNTADITALGDKLAALCAWLSAEHGEVPTPCEQ